MRYKVNDIDLCYPADRNCATIKINTLRGIIYPEKPHYNLSFLLDYCSFLLDYLQSLLNYSKKSIGNCKTSSNYLQFPIDYYKKSSNNYSSMLNYSPFPINYWQFPMEVCQTSICYLQHLNRYCLLPLRFYPSLNNVHQSLHNNILVFHIYRAADIQFIVRHKWHNNYPDWRSKRW